MNNDDGLRGDLVNILDNLRAQRPEGDFLATKNRPQVILGPLKINFVFNTLGYCHQCDSDPVDHHACSGVRRQV